MLLYVEDDEIVARAMMRQLTKVMAVSLARSAAEALEMARVTPQLKAALIDIGLPEGQHAGLKLLADLREARPDMVGAFLTGQPDAEIANAAAVLGAPCLRKPVESAELFPLLTRLIIVARGRTGADPLDLVEARYRLSRRESGIVRCVAAGKRLQDYAAEVGIEESTVKVHVKRLLRKVQAPSVAAFVIRVLREQLEADRDPGAPVH